ncbi:MAG: hypothetical protein KGL39_31385 [Patescibacteria group bacterium]|nr:hypothetical protein [Patescibacteria group bacterium]
MSKKLKHEGRQQAGEMVGSSDIDTSMFWFGDLNVWGAFPTVPTVYQKPRSQVFYMTRNWFERQVYVRQIILLRYAIFNYGFRLTAEKAESGKRKAETEWAKKNQQVQAWLNEKWFGIPIKKIVAQFARDAWLEWLIQDNAIAVWRKRRSGTRPILQPVEQCAYDDLGGIERLSFAHGMTRPMVNGMGFDKQQKEALLSSKDILLVKQGNTTTSDLYDFEICKRARFGFGLAWPQLRTIFNTVGAWESLELADWQLCDALRTVYELHKIGHEIKNGPHAGSAAHFLKKTRAEAVRRQITTRKDQLAAVRRLIVNFDHGIEYPRPDPKHFQADRYSGMLDRLLYWSMPLGQMLFAKSVNPFLMPMLKAQATNEREFVGEFIQTVLVKTLGAPEFIKAEFSDDVFWDSRLLADILKTGLTAGPLSQTTWLESMGVNPQRERQNKEEENDLPPHQVTPIFDAAHGDKPGAKGGRPAGGGDKKPRKSETEA